MTKPSLLILHTRNKVRLLIAKQVGRLGTQGSYENDILIQGSIVADSEK